MQIFLKLKGENIVLPIAYRYFVQGMIYHALESEPEYSRFLHNGGYKDENKSFKLFTFSPLIGNYRVEDKKIVFSGIISLEIRTAIPEITQILLKAFYRGNSVKIGRNDLTIESCILKNKTVFKNEAEITPVSPVVAYVTRNNTNRIYFSPNEDEFCDFVVNNAKRKWLSTGRNESDFYLSIKKKGERQPKKEVTLFKKTYITAWYVDFILCGNPEVIDFLYNVGIGSKNSQGFGMFEIIE